MLKWICLYLVIGCVCLNIFTMILSKHNCTNVRTYKKIFCILGWPFMVIWFGIVLRDYIFDKEEFQRDMEHFEE